MGCPQSNHSEKGPKRNSFSSANGRGAPRYANGGTLVNGGAQGNTLHFRLRVCVEHKCRRRISALSDVDWRIWRTPSRTRDRGAVCSSIPVKAFSSLSSRGPLRAIPKSVLTLGGHKAFHHKLTAGVVEVDSQFLAVCSDDASRSEFVMKHARSRTETQVQRRTLSSR